MLPVEVVRSSRRQKTVSAELVDGTVRVLVPSWMVQSEIDRYVDDLVPRLERRFRSDHVDLAARAATVAARHGLPRPSRIIWADPRRQWGSCNVHTGEIRISRRLAEHPPWVLDYVIVHELAHLVHGDHSPEFHALVDRYKLAERARGYLFAVSEARGGRGDEPTDPTIDEPDDLEESETGEATVDPFDAPSEPHDATAPPVVTGQLELAL
jgi:predicted metal-dependent hydrolase